MRGGTDRRFWPWLWLCVCARWQRKKGFANAHLFATDFDCHTYKSYNRFNSHVCIMKKHVSNSNFFWSHRLINDIHTNYLKWYSCVLLTFDISSDEFGWPKMVLQNFNHPNVDENDINQNNISNQEKKTMKEKGKHNTAHTRRTHKFTRIIWWNFWCEIKRKLISRKYKPQLMRCDQQLNAFLRIS